VLLKAYRPLIVGVLLTLAYARPLADGLSDLHAALDRLNGEAAVTARLRATVWNAQGEGEDRFETEGEARVVLEDDARGFNVVYSKDLLERLEAEQQAQVDDPDVPTPTTETVRTIGGASLRRMVAAADDLRRSVKAARFLSEQHVDYEGTPARLLTFERDIATIGERDRKYVKQFESVLKVWIAADGTPLAHHSRTDVKGRVFFFIRFSHMEESSTVYAQEGNRLVATRYESQSKSAGGGESVESKVVKVLQVQPPGSD
jgi:hypothetical protein